MPHKGINILSAKVRKKVLRGKNGLTSSDQNFATNRKLILREVKYFGTA